jgi:hypothetical protein
MHLATEQSTATSRTLPRAMRVLVWLCVTLFTVGLLLASTHHHDLADVKTDCVSCHVAGNLLADLPPVNAVLMAVLLAVAYVLARLPVYRFAPAPSYLIPARQAPPAVSPTFR